MEEKWLIEQFKWLHRHPELGNCEYETTRFLTDILREHHIQLLNTGLETGAIAVVGSGNGPVVGLRCDIDALPIHEETGLPYASENDGVMHACGHDFHAACMLGAALLLKERESELPGTVKIVFQPAEEIDHGGRFIVSTGLLNDVQVFYAGHTYPWFEPGTLGIKPGPVMAAADRFAIKLTGKGAHAAHPEMSVDVIPAMAALIQTAQTIVSRTVDPFDSAVVSICRAEAGNTWNILPEEAILEGTVRALVPSVRDGIQAKLERIVHSTAQAYGCEAAFDYHRGPDPVVNDESACTRAAALAKDMGFTVQHQAGTMGAEDFSDYLAIAPGAFIRVGTGGGVDAHHPKFTADPKALYPAAKYFATLAEAELCRLFSSVGEGIRDK
ncbi:MAG: amidohydrolase [bacterium]